MSARAVPRSYKENSWFNEISSVRESVKKRGSWKGAAVQRGLEHGSRGIAIVGAVTKQLLVETLRARKDF
jgi:hypothetical protein